jgi:UV DNA damage endonuclease
MRLGLCCTFVDEDIRFRVTTARYLSTLSSRARARFLGELALENAMSLRAAVSWCAARRVGAFRVLSQFFPVATHPALGYDFEKLPTAADLRSELDAVRGEAARLDIRLSLHPDQFVVPGSESESAAKSSIVELDHQARVAEWIGAEQITLHGGGARPTKQAALDRLEQSLPRLSSHARRLLVLENDDRVFTVEDLLPLCERSGLPLVYDVHHHRCHPDRLDVARATALAGRTWHGREPFVHLSSPRHGWGGSRPESHADFIRPSDFPRQWLGQRLTVDVEAKAKEEAVLRLRHWLAQIQRSGSQQGGSRRVRPHSETGRTRVDALRATKGGTDANEYDV